MRALASVMQVPSPGRIDQDIWTHEAAPEELTFRLRVLPQRPCRIHDYRSLARSNLILNGH